jgi:hypothetical protein
MKIESFSPAVEAELISFLNTVGTSNRGFSVLGYHYPSYLRMLQHVLGPGTTCCSFIARCPRTSAIRGFLPGMLRTINGQACYNSLPFFGPNAGVLCLARDPDEEREISASLIHAAVAAAREKRALTAVFYTCFNPFADPASEFATRFLSESFPGCIQVPKTTHFLTLAGTDALRFPSTIRYDLKKAEQARVVVTRGCPADKLEQLYAIYVRNCLDQGIPRKPFDCLQMLHQASITESTVHFYTASIGDDLVGGLITLWGPLTVSYYLPCSRREYRAQQPGTLAIAHAMQHATEHGRSIWNWESTSEQSTGVAHFKRKWGSETATYNILVVTIEDEAKIRTMTPQTLSLAFPFYYVYPWSLLQGVHA